MTEIDADAFDGVEGLTVLGEPDSRAERFARQMGFGFVALP